MAFLNRYFTSPIFFIFLPFAVFSQQNGFSRLNLILSTLPVQTTLSNENNTFSRTNPSKIQTLSTTSNENIFFDNCGGSAAGGEVTSAPPSVTVSPDSKVWNGSNAVDGDVSTYSELRIGLQQKDVEVVQKISFGSTTNASDVVKITLSLDTALMNYKVTARAYSGNTAVGTVQVLTDLLQLRPNTVDVTFSPGVIFDEVRLSVIALQNGNHRARINLHEISIVLPPPSPAGETGTPTPTSSNVTACEGSVVLNVESPTAGLIYKWYNSANVLMQESTSTSYSPALSASGSPYVYYLSSARATGCTIESAKHQINLTVNPKPTTPAIALSN
jgi:large repetitive protein